MIRRRAALLQMASFGLGAALLSRSRSAFAETTQYTYDTRGRLVHVQYDDGSTVTYTYDAAGNRTQVAHNAPTFTQTIAITGSGPVNLRTLANNAGYNGFANATVTYQVGSGVTITGDAGAADSAGGVGIDTGTWPTSSFTIALTLQILSGGIVRGGGGGGGSGGDTSSGNIGGNGGDAIYCQVDMSGGITINSGGTVQGGGAGGLGGSGYDPDPLNFGDPTYGGGGGGGGKPNGAGGNGGNGDLEGGGGAGGSNGNAGTTSSAGSGGAAGGGSASAGGAGGGYGAAAYSNAGGYAVRKSGHTATVTNNGTATGTVG